MIFCGALVVPIGWLPKVRLVAESVSVAKTPVPERATTCGLLAALSVIVREPERTPLVVGLNVTLIVQLEPAAMPLPQLLV